MRSGVSTRLVFCLGLLLGSGQTCAAEAHGRLEVNGSAEWTQAQAETAGDIGDGGIGKLVKGDGADTADTAGDTGSPGRSASGDRSATKPEEGEAGESADGTGEIPVMIGECTGKRFKKCR